ncbi:MAG TPA: hypothetical protein VJ302_05730 [Blastocatellia bacterium]|nr:hypothetical protein [Blastocatellia bacterium]
MRSQNPHRLVRSAVLLSALILTGIGVSAFGLEPAPPGTQSKNRDHLTEKEDELVREVQELDKRIEIYVKAGDRRVLVLTNPNATQKKKEQEAWGPLPTGSKLELLQDYKRILEEAEEKLDDALNRTTKNPALEKALNKLKEGAMRQIPQLRALAAQLTEKNEQRALAEAIEEAETVTKASTDQ